MKFLEVLGVSPVKVHSCVITVEVIVEVATVKPPPWVNGCVSPLRPVSRHLY